MLTLYGRTNSVTVRKVLWLLEELEAPYQRIEAGMEHGLVDTPAYRALNPNGRIPTLVDGGTVLWESNSCLRYLAMTHGDRCFPAAPAARASVDRWLDWQLSTLSGAERMMFWGMIRTPPGQRDMAAVAASVRDAGACWAIVEAQLGDGRAFIEGADFTLADIVLGAYAGRWFGVPVEGKRDLPALAAWFARIAARRGFQRWLAGPLT